MPTLTPGYGSTARFHLTIQNCEASIKITRTTKDRWKGFSYCIFTLIEWTMTYYFVSSAICFIGPCPFREWSLPSSIAVKNRHSKAPIPEQILLIRCTIPYLVATPWRMGWLCYWINPYNFRTGLVNIGPEICTYWYVGQWSKWDDVFLLQTIRSCTLFC
jgi:hypothetical protein